MNRLALRFSVISLAMLPMIGWAQSSARTTQIGAGNSQAGIQATLPGTSIGQNGENRYVRTAVPFLLITPDSRSAALGDAGVALSPDANAAYWNSAKLAFIDKAYGGSLSYTPWLGKITNDMWVAHLSGFYKLNHRQAVGASLKYFNSGSVNFRDDVNSNLGTFTPRDMALDVTYSQLLSEHFSIGGSLRYIYSNLTGSSAVGNDAHSGNAIAADVGVFYTKPMQSSNSTLSLGASITNIGNKITYTSAKNAFFIPTNLKIGGAYKTEVGPRNTFTFLLDFNKLMTPSPNATLDENQKPLLSGILGSFGDAQGGLKEEFREINTSAGVEYWYADAFAARLGYFYETKDKGNRKYLTSGIGLRYEQFGLDVAYLVPTNQRENALAETIRFTLLIHVAAKTREQEALTD